MMEHAAGARSAVGFAFAFTNGQMPTALQNGRMFSRTEGDGRLRRLWKRFIASRLPGRRSSSRSLPSLAPIAFAATVGGALVALCVIATKALIGAAVFFGHDPLVMLSAVLIQTGVLLTSLAMVSDVPTRGDIDREPTRKHL
jgi:hypothetical protein